ncbi:methylated-DNA--[protein]-cysteine S-methyltransferase [Pikeienuella piscinae]|uniref:Methylated-DNA--[protein]-cysteine S-methyltransferase n=1 Tax=Pikeienuella piscinae TaxID=2748098 RepID=A0A7L5BZE0_9RHOB|nr:methylated-DNA--[protein]-cysteine S-methyltransferase [Pikeienuella piscinae]QIE56473.1 methylated-DNA--[protein]-cysteine S-methyltransferase [Pikeienuella piscinae]
MPHHSTETALGRFTIEAADGAITGLRWGGPVETAKDPLLIEAAAQLGAYADGRLRAFDLPLAPAGGPLQQAVMAAMRRIPFGETLTYGKIAAQVGAPAQAIGQCCGANPIPVIIPCHRVTGTGKLGGFSAPGGVETKVALLRHEGAYSLLI